MQDIPKEINSMNRTPISTISKKQKHSFREIQELIIMNTFQPFTFRTIIDQCSGCFDKTVGKFFVFYEETYNSTCLTPVLQGGAMKSFMYEI